MGAEFATADRAPSAGNSQPDWFGDRVSAMNPASPPRRAERHLRASRYETVFVGLVVCTMLAFAVALYHIFNASVEMQMGIVQKIFYVHVPSAYAMYLGFVTCALASAAFLIQRSPRAEAISVAGAEVGLMFCVVVLTTGPLWARKAWGVYWTWDPRLTTTLLAGLVFSSFVVLRSLGGGLPERKFAAALAIFGLLDLPVIHYSVQRWRGQHPTVITAKGGGLAPDMYPALWWSFVAFTGLVAVLLWARTRLEHMRGQCEQVRWQLEDHLS
jgi:heme exporter protein C